MASVVMIEPNIRHSMIIITSSIEMIFGSTAVGVAVGIPVPVWTVYSI